MYKPSRTEFKKLAQHYDVIPVWREVVADADTPVSAFLKLGGSENAFLLESADRGEQFGRYSFLGAGAQTTIKAKGSAVEVREGVLTKTYQSTNPLFEVRRLLANRPAPAGPLPGFYGGAVGYIGYDSIRHFERLPSMTKDDLHLPDLAFMVADTVLIFDHLKHKIVIVSNAKVNGDPATSYNQALADIDATVGKLETPVTVSTLPPAVPIYAGPMRGNVGKEEFEGLVEKAKEYISAGDIFQVVLSQRFSTKLDAEPFDVYRILRTINPSPYMAFIKMSDFALAGASPEPLITVTGRRLVTRPIAGTRKRGATDAEDAAFAEELLEDEKERAEHIMLVDLGRNDLGRVCRPGTVCVDEMMVVERYSHVMHLVSTVSGELSDEMDALEALKASFPAGTVSGAPKIRAMEIIDELEVSARGPYAGVYGYLGYAGDLDCGITIRTVVMSGGLAHIQAGAGIVADSIPSREYDECVNKARALFAAVAGANAAAKTGRVSSSSPRA
ncbi:MAG: anthranilate synthase component I [Actinobacteria bacterium]|nr:anthranilate synthase component I [Actinomycetota bacterium]